MPIELKHCFVFTGAPGTGKTSLLEALRRHGQRCV
ncbi:ATP-binding protein, partial [Pseudomonas aeruginosa]|nr:ATP-binding protein [Pseudomonas aeruginosa]